MLATSIALSVHVLNVPLWVSSVRSGFLLQPELTVTALTCPLCVNMNVFISVIDQQQTSGLPRGSTRP